MKNTLKYLSYAGLLALALPTQAASVITVNNSFVEGYLYVEDIDGYSYSAGNGMSSFVGEHNFYAYGGDYFDGYLIGNPAEGSMSGYGEGYQNSFYDVDHFYGEGSAVTGVDDPNNELSFIQTSGESLVDITFEIATGYTYTLTGNLFAEAQGDVNLYFDGNSASEVDGAYSFSGYLAAGTHNLSIDAIAALADTGRAYSDFTYDLQLTAVPVPAAVWLFGSGLLGLITVARRRKNA